MGGHLWRFYTYVARCRDCGWESSAKNAQANAAMHSRRYNHTVNVDIEGIVSYLSDDDHIQQLADKEGT